MSGVIHKIGEALHMGGGQKEEDKHKAEHHSGDHHTTDVHHQQQYHGGEHKEGLVDKIKQQIPGAGTTDVHHQQQQQYHGGEHREGEHKEGLVDKIKQKIPGVGGGEGAAHGEEKKKNHGLTKQNFIKFHWFFQHKYLLLIPEQGQFINQTFRAGRGNYKNLHNKVPSVDGIYYPKKTVPR